MQETIELITLNQENIAREHICCALADKKSEKGISLKKEWLKSRFAEGLKFIKANVRGKVFIEYIPAEFAWSPITASDYMFINCLWVAGRFKGMGLGSRLLEECIKDAKDKNGIVILSSKNKKPYLADKKFLLKKGFIVCDTAPPFFELMVKRFKDAPLPRFKENAQKLRIEGKEDLSILYTNQCPFTESYVQEVEEAAKEYNLTVGKKRIISREEAQNCPSPYTTYSIYYKGFFITHEILSKDKFMKIMDNLLVAK